MSATYVAIIMDGNGRWAHQHGVPIAEGHKAGADTVKARLRDAVDLGVRELTLYSFSTENWSRPQDEVDALMALFSARIIDETPELHEEGVKMRFVGRREGVLPELIEQMAWAEDKTASNTRITLFVAFNYGGRVGDPRRGGAVHGRRRGGVPAAAVRAGDARPGPADPHLAASSGSPTTCCGRPRTASCTSPTCCGRTSRARTSRRRSPATRRACAASEDADGVARRRGDARGAAQEGHVGPAPADPGRDPGDRLRRR